MYVLKNVQIVEGYCIIKAPRLNCFKIVAAEISV